MVESHEAAIAALAVALLVVSTLMLWMLSFGYAFGLSVLARRRGEDHPPGAGTLPPIEVVVPVLNERGALVDKLRNLDRLNYPGGISGVVFVDGGSDDGSQEFLEHLAATRADVGFLRVPAPRSKTDQLRIALGTVSEDMVLVTDVDSRLDVDCARVLVEALMVDPELAVAGAAVRPATDLLEERLHWWLLNRVWWLEGRVAGSSMVSGVCFACRKSMIDILDPEVRADDIHVATGARVLGHRSRLVLEAVAHELRVPRTIGDMVRFRRRRGHAYRAELGRLARRGTAAPTAGWVARIHLWQFRATPVAVAVWLASSAVMSVVGSAAWPGFAALLFLAPAIGVLARFRASLEGQPSWFRIGLAGLRLAMVTLYALATLRWRKPSQEERRCH
jgi:cellulose synthase/poly-beta-1,6-N-acetylglucosamine synthase-like glycosyltransferase